LTALGSQNPPGVNFEPDEPTKSTDIASARNAETYRHYIDRVNKRKDLQTEIMSLFCTDGRTVLYSTRVNDAQQFGVDDETGEANGGEIIAAFGVLETKAVPIVAKKQSLLVAFFLSDEIDVFLAKKSYPEHATEIKEGQAAGVSESAYERIARGRLDPHSPCCVASCHR
jgi:hypothetical protein